MPSANNILQAMQDNLPSRTVTADLQGRILALSRPARRLLATLGVASSVDDLAMILNDASKALATVAEGRAWASPASRIAGQTARLSVYAYPILAEHESVGCLVELSTEDEALHQMHEAFFEYSEDLFCVASQDGYFLHLSPSWSRHTGWRLDELRATPYLEFVHPDDRQPTIDEAARLRHGPTTTVRFENRYRCSDGSYKRLQWNAYAPTDGAIYAVARDVTTEQAKANELAAAHRDIETDERSKLQFMQGALHDLAGALTPIRLTVATLRHQQGQAQRIGRLEHLVQHLDGLVKDIRDSLMLGLNKVHLQRQNVALAAALQPTLDTYQEMASTQGIVLEEEMGAYDVDADPFRLNQVMHNLLSNAFKFTPEGGRIRVSTRQAVEGIEVTVADSGRGLEVDEINSLFQPFVQVHKQEEAKERGTGLGLCISRQIIDAHGGRIWVESPGKGHGSMFRFTLPPSNAKARGQERHALHGTGIDGT